MTEYIQNALSASPGPVTLRYADKDLEKGEFIPRQTASIPPSVKLTAVELRPSEQRFVVIAIDLDAPYPSFHPLGPILHWISTGLRIDQHGFLTDPEATISWVPANPPPLSGPHRYVVMVFDHPDDFDMTKFRSQYPPDMALTSRVRWDVDGFVRDFGLVHNLGGSYFESR